VDKVAGKAAAARPRSQGIATRGGGGGHRLPARNRRQLLGRHNAALPPVVRYRLAPILTSRLGVLGSTTTSPGIVDAIR
jgi:hypothetical protein